MLHTTSKEFGSRQKGQTAGEREVSDIGLDKLKKKKLLQITICCCPNYDLSKKVFAFITKWNYKDLLAKIMHYLLYDRDQ